MCDASEPEEVFIAYSVMGPTGTGKSSFVNLLSDSDLRVGQGMESCTSSVQTTQPFEFEGRKITLIDTPGFDDTTIRDADVLAMIAAYLCNMQQKGKTLAGVIYMHRILDNRMGGISARNFKMFRHLCGDASLKSVVIVTSMWDQVDLGLAEARERELASKECFFKPALDKGARLARHYPIVSSGQAILHMILSGAEGEPQEAVRLQIQRELCDGVPISDTQAGQALHGELDAKLRRCQDDLRQLMSEIREASCARDDEMRRELVNEKEKLQMEIARVQEDSVSLAARYADALTKLETRMAETESVIRVARGAPPATDAHAPEHVQEGIEQPKGIRIASVASTDNAVLEGKLGMAFPVFGFWGRLAVMLSPFSLSWK